MSSIGQTQLLAEGHIPGFVFGISPAMRSVNDTASEIAPTDIPILIVGESGTGKDAYARLIHNLSSKPDAPFHKVNCATVDISRLSSQMRPDENLYPSANTLGTLYLDNIQELEMAAQRVLLSLLPEETNADGFSMRLVCSSAINLEPEIEAGRFRRELFFRLNGACLRLPSLRDRVQDVPLLAEHFLKKHSCALKRNAPPLTDEAIDSLSSFSWPGNIRQLENLIRKMVVLGDARIAPNDLDVSPAPKFVPSVFTQGISLKSAARAASEKAERELILQALERTHWNRKRAARELQISYKSLLYKIKQIGVSNGNSGN